MILESITLHNFMSYADAQLNLSLVPVACLSGQNGAGKSALLDAITWALWEAARSNSDELVRLGQSEMWVDLTFLHENQTYRVRRSRQHKKGGRSSKGNLDFQIANGNNGGTEWRSLTGANMKETQLAISSVLRMDFDTFSNSAYLRQGKADEFTTRSPLDRKKVLAEILRLSDYDQLQELAKEKARLAKAQIDATSISLASLTVIEEKAKEMSSQLEQAQVSLLEHIDQLSTVESDCQNLNNDLTRLRVSKQKLESADDHRLSLTSDISALIEQEKDLVQKNQNLGNLLAKTSEIEASIEGYRHLKAKVETQDQIAFQHQEWTGKRLEHQSQLATLRGQLEVEFEHKRRLQQESEAKIEKLNKETADQEKIESAYSQYKLLIADESEQAKKQETFTRLNERANGLQSKIQEASIRQEAEIAQKQSLLKELETLINSKEAIEEEHKQIQTRTADLDKLETEYEHVEESGLAVKSDLETLLHSIEDLKRRQKENDLKIKELNEHQDSTICPLCSGPIVDRQAVIERYRSENDSLNNDILRHQGESNRLEEERSKLRERYVKLRKELEQRKALDKQIGQFNEKQLALARAKENYEQIQKQYQELRTKFESQAFAEVERESLVAIKAETYKLNFDPVAYSNLQGQIRSQRQIEARFHQHERDLSELKKLQSELPHLNSEVKKLKDALDGETYGVELRSMLAEVNQQMAKVNYNRDEHIKLKQELSLLLPNAEQESDLRRANSEKPKIEESLQSTQATLNSKRSSIEQLEAGMITWQREAAEIPALTAKLEKAQLDLSQARNRKEESAMQAAVLESSHSSLSAEVKILLARKDELKDLQQELDDYLLLSEAFGKKGIQAAIIENAIPEIEAEANRILTRLTENKMHVALITQQQTKSGNLAETLDLLIGDEVGTRSYELYSGGEAFKVNFAIRVSLSKLLARRSGARLETLIIDEGFGSQDEMSRERLVKAIRSIQSDFARILVITHMSDIREMFPVQIHVSKIDGESNLQLVS